jgi:hypothetical protein
MIGIASRETRRRFEQLATQLGRAAIEPVLRLPAVRCFVSSPADISLGAVTRALEVMGVEVRDLRSMSGGAELSGWMRNEMAASDMVLVLLPESRPYPPAFMVEIGVAIGLGKPLLVLTPEGHEVPSDLAGVPYGRVAFDDSEAIALHLRALVQSLKASPGPTWTGSGHAAPQPEVGAWLAQSLRELADRDPGERARLLETLVVELFRRAGGLVESGPPRDDSPDVAVMFDEVPALSGPLLVDVKLYGRGQHPDRSALQQLQRYVAERGALLGILLYWSPGAEPLSQTPNLPGLIAINLSELAQDLQSRALPEVLAVARNRAIHGT